MRAWTQFVGEGAPQAAVRPEILSSWQLSGVVSPTVTHAPLDDEGDTAEFWNQSPLQTAVARVQDELRRTAEDGDLVIAITDEQTRILWTYGGRVMRRKAETVNFVPGGRWDELSVGTNALAIAGLAHRCPVDRLQRRALRRGRPQLGVLGRAGLRPGDRAAARGSSTSRRPGTAPTRSGSRPRA